MKRVFLVAGEASGDLHASLLVEALGALRPDLEFWGVGGTRMEAAGVHLVARSEEIAVVGILEVFERLPQILGILERVRGALGELRPAVFIPVDFPDFNFRLLPRAHRLGIPIVYYISPQLWAWRPGRVYVLRRHLRRMLTIFPFEAEFYRRAGVPVTWVGHPLLDQLTPASAPAEERRRRGVDPAGTVVALLPGSRRSEIRRIAPVLRAMADRVDTRRAASGLGAIRWIVGRAPSVRDEDLGFEGMDTRWTGLEAMRMADLAVIASGTSTLEAALLGRPAIVVYRMNPLTYQIARRAVHVPHIAMANLLAGRRVLPEYVQEEATPEALANETMRLLTDDAARDEIRRGLAEARAALGPPGAAARAAAAILAELDAV